MTDALSSLNAWVEAQLAGAGGAVVLPLLVLGGLVASLLPCVYPLYPITAAIVRKRTGGPAWLHPVVYYGGLVASYATLGLTAAWLGGALQEVLRLGITQIAIGAVLLILAAATAGWVHLSWFHPRAGTERQGVVGTLVMGVGAGLLSSACVGPVVASVLLQVATATETVSLAAGAWAALQLAAFGAGLGLPFLAIGLTGVRLPRSGAWMVWVQRGLAALLLMFAWSYFAKGLEILGFSSNEAQTVMLAGAGLFAFAYLFQDVELDVQARARRSAAVVGAVAAGSLLWGSLSPPGAVVPSAEARTESAVSVEDAGLTWYLDEEAAYAAARREGKNVFIDFYGSWCTNCKAFKEKTRTDPELREALRSAVLLEIRDTSPTFDTYRQDRRFPELKVGLPFFVITNAQGELLYKTNDHLRTEEMALMMEP